MRRDYTRTLFHDDLTEALVTLYFTNAPKYEEHDIDEDNKVEFRGITKWSIIEGGKEAEAIETAFDEDEYHEYLILTFANGKQEVYRNSHVIMFIH